MSVKLVKGNVRAEYFPVTVSTALAINTLVELTSGKVAAADDNDTQLAGVLGKAIAATDDDYADARDVPVLVPQERHVVWEIDTGGSFVATDVGSEFGISDSGTLDRTDTTNKVFLVTKVLSATKVQGYLKINGSY